MSMDLDGSVALPQRALETPTNATILCYNCGAPIDGTTSAGALCYDCVRLSVDISQGVQREATLHFCRDCERWLQPPAHWTVAAPESRELLALCLRKLKGLQKVRIIDASFIWTEPHSRRVKLKITIQQEANQGTILQQTFEVEFVVAYQQCPDCAKSFTANTWRAVVQVRQKVTHKRTFLYLEQLILKHGAHKDCINIQEAKNGLDFFYSQKNHADKFVDFLSSVAPIQVKKSSELISMDTHSATRSYKFTFSCDLVPICKDDLVALPLKLARQIGNIAPLVLCHRIGTTLNVIDPSTCQVSDISTPIYWRQPFTSLADVNDMIEFVVMDIELIGERGGRYQLAEATVARNSDLGANDQTYFTRTHLGNVLHPGDLVLGYHLVGTNFNNENFQALEDSSQLASQIPDVVLVKKSYQRKHRAKARNWRLKRMAKEESEVLPKKADQDRMDRDYEMFLRDVEEDKDLRSTVAIYKAKMAQRKAAMEGTEMETEEPEEEEDDEDDDEGPPEIGLDELLDDFDDMSIGDEEV